MSAAAAAFTRPAGLASAGQPAANRRIRVLHVISTLERGGTEMAMLRLVRHLDPATYRFQVAYLRGEPDLAAEVESATGSPPFGVGLRRKADPLALWRLCRLVQRERIDLVHTHMDLADYYGAGAARLGGARGLVSSKQNADEFRTRRTWKRYPFLILERIAYEAADAVIVVSESLSDFLVTAERLPRRKMLVIGNGVDASLGADAPPREESRRRLGLEARDPLLGTVGRLAPQKGLIHLLDALPAILRAFPRAGLALAGEGPSRLELERRAAHLGLADRVTFLGRREDVPAVLAALDLFLLPSLWEGLPQALLEAMAMSLPVVAARCVGAVDLIEDGRTGILVPPGDPEALATAAAGVLKDRAMARRLGAEARKVAVERHSLKAVAGRVDRVYRDVLGRRA